MAEAALPELNEPTITTARGRPLTDRQANQLNQARQSKARIAEENRIRQQEALERIAGIENLLVKAIPTMTEKPKKRAREEEQSEEEAEEMPAYPDPAPRRKRQRLTNPHRARHPDNDEHYYTDHETSAGWGWGAKIFTLGGLIAFNSVVAFVMRKAKQSASNNANTSEPPPTDIVYV